MVKSSGGEITCCLGDVRFGSCLRLSLLLDTKNSSMTWQGNDSYPTDFLPPFARVCHIGGSIDQTWYRDSLLVLFHISFLDLEPHTRARCRICPSERTPTPSEVPLYQRRSKPFAVQRLLVCSTIASISCVIPAFESKRSAANHYCICFRERWI